MHTRACVGGVFGSRSFRGIGSLVFSDILNIKFLGRTIEMSDYRDDGLSRCRTIEMSDYRVVPLSSMLDHDRIYCNRYDCEQFRVFSRNSISHISHQQDILHMKAFV